MYNNIIINIITFETFICTRCVCYQFIIILKYFSVFIIFQNNCVIFFNITQLFYNKKFTMYEEVY